MERAWKHLELLPDTYLFRSDAWMQTSQSRDGPEEWLGHRHLFPNLIDVT